MGEGYLLNLGNQAIMVLISLTAPILLAALIVGVLISILQAVTQIQDMTLTFVPKFFVILLIFGFMGGFMLTTIKEFTINIISNIAFFAG